MEKKNYVVAVDLGSTAVVVGVAAKAEDGTMEIQALVSQAVKGVSAGRIENIEDVSQALDAAFKEAGQQAGIRITSAYAGLSGDFVRCARHTDYVYVTDPKNGVSRQDLEALFDRMRNLQAPEGEVIMERIPQNYMLDQGKEVENPIGSFGSKLSSTFNFVLCERTPIWRLDMALKRVGVELIETVPNVLVTAESVLTEDEKEDGVAVIDVGGGVTDVVVYHRGVVRYVASIPIGAGAINHDIRAMGVPERFVERLKLEYGSALVERVPEGKLIRVKGRGAKDTRDIMIHNLVTAIEARTMDIIDLVKEELKMSGYAQKLNYGLVLTGGLANLKDVDELFRRCTQLEVRIAQPDVNLTEESCALAANPTYATVVGLLARGTVQSQVVLPPVVQPVEPAQPVKPATPATPVQPRKVEPVVAPKPATPATPVAPVTPVAEPKQEPTKVEPERPVEPLQKPYVPPVVPASELVQEKPDEEEIDDEDIYEKPKQKGGFWSTLSNWAKKFEDPNDDEI